MSRLLTFILFYIALSGCYSIRQAFYQNNLFNGRQKISALINDPNSDMKLKKKLATVDDILSYAEKSGLRLEGNYRYYIEIGEKPVSFLVKAAEPFEMKFKTWWFPFVGSVPYLGFFSSDERDEEAEALAKDGYDILKSGAAAFSGLGWFEDPIYSSMLKRKDESLAHLLFHELTHRTIWMEGEVSANENLAEFVADLLTEAFLLEKGWKEELEEFRRRRADEQEFRIWLASFKQSLENYYLKSADTLPVKRLEEKKKIIAQYLSTEKRPLFKSSWDPITAYEWNNATILTFGLYGMETQMFAKAYACLNQGLPGFFAKLEELADEDAALLEKADQVMCQ